MAPKAAFRVDSSLQIGTGHIMRCLALADHLSQQRNYRNIFVCRPYSGNIAKLIREHGHEVVMLPESRAEEWQVEDVDLGGPRHANWVGASSCVDAEQTRALLATVAKVDWLVVDHYGLDARWERSVRSIARRLLVIDDLADRQHACNILLDQNFYAEPETRYAALAPESTTRLLGPRYLILRQEFVRARAALRARDGIVRRILVFFGGSDPTNQTGRALDGIDELSAQDLHVDVVVGTSNPYQGEIRSFCSARPWATYHCQVSNMAALIASADLGIGAGGISMWERCALGLPSLTVVLSENQVEPVKNASDAGLIEYLGAVDGSDPINYSAAVSGCLNCPDRLRGMSVKALGLLDISSGGLRSIMAAMDEVDGVQRGS